MEDLGIDDADIGLPGSSKRAFDDVLRMCKEVIDCKMKIRIACAGPHRRLRHHADDRDLAARRACPIEVYAFIGSSPIRQYAEEWDVDAHRQAQRRGDRRRGEGGPPGRVRHRGHDALAPRGADDALQDGDRSRRVAPLPLATPSATRRPTACATSSSSRRASSPARARDVGIDWHGHNDRGLALENALWALEFGADRVHGTALGIGERVGNAQMELILLNLKLLGQLEAQDLTKLARVLQDRRARGQLADPDQLPARRARRLPHRDRRARRGDHQGDGRRATRGSPIAIYSGVPAGMFGRKQEICIGFMSGASNVNYWLRQRKIEPTRTLVEAILQAAKAHDHILDRRRGHGRREARARLTAGRREEREGHDA